MIVRLQQASRLISATAAWVAVAIMIGITCLILLEIFLRSFLAMSTHIAHEFVGYGLGAIVFLGLGHCLIQGGLIRVDLLVGLLPPGLRRAFEITISVITLAVMVYLMNFFWGSILRHIKRGTTSAGISETPLWIPEALIFAGMVVFTLQVLAYTMHLVAGGAIVDAREDVSEY